MIRDKLQQITKLIKLRRVELDLTQEQLAINAGVSFATINRIEGGTHPPSFITLVSVIKALNARLIFKIENKQEVEI